MLAGPCPERRMHPVSRRELDAGVDSKTAAAGFEPAARRAEYADQFHIGSLDHLLMAGPIETVHRPITKSAGSCVCLLYMGNFVS
jgi:hypothetical protein